MTSAIETPRRSDLPWKTIAWFGLLLVACYFPVLRHLIRQCYYDPDMGHAFFVPIISGFIIWQKREELAALKSRPDWRGLILVVWGAVQLFIATLGTELFTARIALILTLVGLVWTLGGIVTLKKLAFPLFLLLFMIPIPQLLYNTLTFKLQLQASRLAEDALTLLSVPVTREGNVLELPNQKLSVVEACSGIRSLLSLSFLSLVYGYFFEKRNWVRVTLFFATIPLAIIANASRVTITGLMTQVRAELAEGFFHEAQGWVIFMVGLGLLIMLHGIINRGCRFVAARKAR
ncbi:MAG TPA: exosortase [Candidatus Acidoferrales bacterium]|nr:exosortase [Candidatus Acidoferrales bacterium]